MRARCLHGVAIASLLIGCGSSGDGAPKGEGAKREAAVPVTVQTLRPSFGPFREALSLSAALEAKDRVEVVARVEGPLVALSADLGDRVKAGAVLARIAPVDFEARAQQARAELALARGELSRVKELTRTNMATPQLLDQAETRVAVAESQAALFERQLRDTAVRAPFAGSIARRDVSVGAYVKVGTPLFELVSSEDLRLAVEVPERYVGLTKPGDRIAVALPAGEAEATVVRIAPTVAADRRTYRVEADLAAGPGMAAGMFVTVRLDSGAEVEAARLPRAALFEVLGRPRVVVVEGGAAQPRDVTILGEEGALAVVAGLRAGDEVVSRGAAALAPGTAVTVAPGTTDASPGPGAKPAASTEAAAAARGAATQGTK